MYWGMNFTQLNVFREVMNSGSISQTARKLGRTQPAISAAIKKLEESVGLALFERRGRQLVPVPEARYLLAEVAEVLDRLSHVAGTMKSLQNASSGSLNVAAMPGASAFLFPRFIARNMDASKDVRITFASRSSPQIRELASTQSIDFGFADFDQSIGKVPQYSPEIISADCFCAVNKHHPLAKKATIAISDLDDEPLGTLHRDHPLSRNLMAEFAKSDAVYSSIIDSQFFLPLMPFIAVGHCVAIVDPLTVMTVRELTTDGEQVVFVPLETRVRYEYATLIPLHRPLSQLAQRIKSDWMTELMQILAALDAHPEREGKPDDAKAPDAH